MIVEEAAASSVVRAFFEIRELFKLVSGYEAFQLPPLSVPTDR